MPTSTASLWWIRTKDRSASYRAQTSWPQWLIQTTGRKRMQPCLKDLPANTLITHMSEQPRLSTRQSAKRQQDDDALPKESGGRAACQWVCSPSRRRRGRPRSGRGAASATDLGLVGGGAAAVIGWVISRAPTDLPADETAIFQDEPVHAGPKAQCGPVPGLSVRCPFAIETSLYDTAKTARTIAT